MEEQIKKKKISTGEATRLSGRPRQTLIRWCKDLGIGEKIAGRWEIFPDKLDDVLTGRLTYDQKKNR